MLQNPCGLNIWGKSRITLLLSTHKVASNEILDLLKEKGISWKIWTILNHYMQQFEYRIISLKVSDQNVLKNLNIDCYMVGFAI